MYKYKRNLIDTDLLDYYHIICYTVIRQKNMHHTKPEVDRAWPAYLMAHGPFLVYPWYLQMRWPESINPKIR